MQNGVFASLYFALLPYIIINVTVVAKQMHSDNNVPTEI